MEVQNELVVAVVVLLGKTFLITDEGTWIEVDSIPAQAQDLPVLNESNLYLEDGQPFISGAGLQPIAIPQNIIASLQEQVNSDEQAQSDAISSTTQQGVNFFYQLLQRDADEVIAESGFDTTPDPQDEGQDNDAFFGKRNITIAPPELSITIFDGGDNWLNKYEAPTVDLSGAAGNIGDGEVLVITLTDVNGMTLELTAVAQNELWRLDGVDITGLAEGPIQAEVYARDSIFDDITAQDDSVKDTISAIEVEVIRESPLDFTVDLTGSVTDVQDGQQVIVTISSGGQSFELQSSVENGRWLIKDFDITDLPDNSYVITASTLDLAGNDTSNSTLAFKDVLAEITVNVVTRCSTDGEQFGVVGTTNDIEDGRTVTLTFTDSQGNTVIVETITNNNVYAIETVDLSSLVEGPVSVTAQSTDLTGNQAQSTTTFEIDRTAMIDISIEQTADGVLNAVEDNTLTVNGTVTDVEDGQTVFITLTDSSGQIIEVQTVVENGAFSITVDASEFVDGPISATAVTEDTHCNSATDSDNVDHDKSAAISVVIDGIDDNAVNAQEATGTPIYGTVADIEDGQLVTVTVSDKDGNSVTFTTTVINQAWRIDAADLTTLSDGTLNVTAQSTDVAGNPTTSSTSIFKDTQAALSVEVNSGDDNTLNFNEITKAPLFGSATDLEDGAVVTVTVTDINGVSLTFDALVKNGLWSAGEVDLSSLAEGTLSIEASATDRAGNEATTTTSVIKDTQANISITVETGSDGVINKAEAPSTRIFGTTDVEDGQQILVTVTDGVTTLRFVTTANAGQWSIENADLSGLNDGNLSFSASTLDQAGNPAQSNAEHLKDTLAEINFEVDDADQVINAQEQAATTINGTVSEIEDGQTVFVTISDGSTSQSHQATVVSGQWQLADLDLSAFADGTLTIEAQSTDIAGNPATFTDTVEKDTLAEITIDVATGTDTIINGEEVTQVSASGAVTNVEDGQTVVVRVTDINGRSGEVEVIVENGQWRVDATNLTLFAEGTLTFEVFTQDQAGNPATASVGHLKDTIADITVEIADGPDALINRFEVDAVTLSGAVDNVEDGQQVIVTLTDSTGRSVVYTTTITGGMWELADVDFSEFAQGPLTVTAETTDIAGNEATATDRTFIDTEAALSIRALDGGDGILNTAESNPATIGGVANDIATGQIVLVTVTDSQGNSLNLSATVQNGFYVITNVDLSTLADGTLTLRAVGTDENNNPAIATSNVVKNTAPVTITMDIDTVQDETINAAEAPNVDITGTTTNVENGQTVTVTLTDDAGNTIELTTPVFNNTWRLDDVDTRFLIDGQINGYATVTNKAGNSGDTTDIVDKDVVAQITVQLDDADGVINAAEQTTAQFSGTLTDVDDGQPVTITVRDSLGVTLTFSATVSAGQWQLSDADISTLADGEITVTVNTSDVPENPAQAQTTFEKDTQAIINLTVVDGDQVINAAEQSAVRVIGTVNDVENGQTVTLTITDGTLTQNFTTTVVNGAWQLANLDLSAFADGTLTVTADTTDVAGNPATFTNTIEKDTLAEITIDVATGTDTIINGEEVTQISASGTVNNIEDGQAVVVMVTDINGRTGQVEVLVENGQWQVSNANLAAFAEGPLTFTVSSEDVAGNPASDTAEHVKDTLADISITIEDGSDALINSFEVDAVTLSGAVENVEDGQTITLTLQDSAGNTATFTTVVSGNTWTLADVDFTSFAQGPLTVTAEVTDIAGNTATASDTTFIDTEAGFSIRSADGGDGVLNIAESNPATLGGTATDIETGQVVIVTVTDSEGTVLSFTTTVRNGFYVIENADLSSLADGTLTLRASGTDSNNNPATAISTVEKVTAPVTITMDIDTVQDETINAAEAPMVDISGTTTNVEDGQTVTVTLTDSTGATLELTAVVTNNTWTISDVDTRFLIDGVINGYATVTNVAGNSGETTDVVDKDVVAEISVQLNDSDNVVNAAEQTNTEFSGSLTDVDDGQLITLTLTDSTGASIELTTTVISGQWQISGADISTLADGEITATVNTQDVPFNPATDSTTFIKDTQAAVTIDVNTGNDEVINLAETPQTVISGTVSNVEDGQTVTITVSDGSLTRQFTTTVNGGVWQLPATDLSDFADGELTFSADTVDVAGNPATSSTTHIKDTLASINVTIDSGDDEYLVAADTDSLTITGSVENIEAGQTVTLVLTGANGETQTVTATIASDLTYTVTGVDISSWSDGQISVQASATDVAGNPASNTDTAVIDTTINIDIDTGANGINGADFRSGFVNSLSGTTDAEPGQTVTITISDGSTNKVYTATVLAGGVWTVDGIDIGGLNANQVWSINAEVTDLAGNTATDETPDIDPIDSLLFNEIALNTATSITKSAIIDIDNAELSFSEAQAGLTALTANGNELTLVVSADGKTLSLVLASDPSDVYFTAKLVGTELVTTLLQAIDQPDGPTKALIYIDALQTDADGTSELVVIPTEIEVRDAIPITQDDAYQIVEDTTSQGSLTGNDFTPEGPLKVVEITFDGRAYAVADGAPAVITNQYGTLTVNSNGTWTFDADGNIDNSVLQQFNIDYKVADNDGGGRLDTATATFTIVDGEAGTLPQQSTTLTEIKYSDLLTTTLSFTVSGGSDAVVPDTLAFSTNTIGALQALNLTSNGNALSFSISSDGKTLTASTIEGNVFSIALSALQNGRDLDASAAYEQYLPLDNISSELFELPFYLTAQDIDGTEIAENIAYINLQDGDNPSFSNVTNVTVDENLLQNGPQQDTGQFTINIGSDQLAKVNFSAISKQPALTVLGIPVIYDLSADGKTIIGHLGDIDDPVLKIVIADIQNSTTDNTNLDYTFTLYRAIDEVGDGTQPVQIEVTDFDGDTVFTNLNITIVDSTNGSETAPRLSVSEQPNATDAVNFDEGLILVEAGADAIVDILVNVTSGDAVLDSNGDALTQNGEAILWAITGNGIAQGRLADGTVVFQVTLPEDLIVRDETLSVPVRFELFAEIDHLDPQGEQLTIIVPIASVDADGTLISDDMEVVVSDGSIVELNTPSVAGSTVDEANLTSQDIIATNGQLDITNGSDEVVEIRLADGFSLTGITTAGGDPVTLASTANSDGWYIASASNGEVFRIRFNPDGSYEYRQSQALDQANGNDRNTLDLVFSVQAVDADNDISNSQTVTIVVQDDVPTNQDTEIELTEGESGSVDVLAGAAGGADGSVVSAITYNNTNYNPGDTFDLIDVNTGDIYGEATVNADGTISISTVEFADNVQSYVDTITYTLLDKDGDTQVNTLTITTVDNAGRILFIEPVTDEDTSVELQLAAYPGDIDQNELVTEIRISVASLQGGTLELDGTPVRIEGDFYVIDDLQYADGTGQLLEGSAFPNGTLTFTPAADSSDATQNVVLEVEADISRNGGTDTITTNLAVGVNSVADTPLWDASSEFDYNPAEDGSVVEGGGPVSLNLLANLQDNDGSEQLTYTIDNIKAGLTLTYLDSSARITVTNGMVLTAIQVASLEAQAGENAAGLFTFDITATATELDNNDTANSTTEQVSLYIQPVADTPNLAVRNLTANEDERIDVGRLISGSLTDTDGSETLSYELVLPAGFTLEGDNGAVVTDLGNGVWQVSAADVAAGNVFLVPLKDSSEETTNVNEIGVTAISTESEVDGVSVFGSEARSEQLTLDLRLIGVIDPPDVDNSLNPDWVFDNTDPGNLTLTNTNGVEDTDLALNFVINTSDADASEFISIVIKNLPPEVTIVDANGNPVNLPVVGFENGEPIFSLTAEQLSTYSLRPAADFSGSINFDIEVVTTEPDGDSGSYTIAVNTEFTPVIDNNALSLATFSTGEEDKAAVINLSPNLADVDGSEIITGAEITGLPAGVILLFDGEQINFTSPLDLSTLIDSSSPTLQELLDSGRLAILPPEDASGVFNIDVRYTIVDTSPTGDSAPQTFDTTASITVTAQVDKEVETDGESTRFDTPSTALVSNNGVLDLTGQVQFIEADIDGSETIDYLVIILPSGEGFSVSHPNGAIPDGDGRWLIPTDGNTSNSTVDTIDALAGVVITADNASNGPISVTVGARVLDGTDAEAILGSFNIEFTSGAADSAVADIGQLQNSIVDGVEDQSITLGEHLATSVAGDGNDEISFRILASDLPDGAVLSGAGVEVIHDASGKNIIEYVFREDALPSLTLTSAGEDFAGLLNIPIRIIAVDPISGETNIDDNQIISIDVVPVVDSGDFLAADTQMQEDTPKSLGIVFTPLDNDTSATTGGVETVDLSQPLAITLLDGGTLFDPSGLFTDNGGGVYQYTGTQEQLAAALAGVGITPPEHVAGSDLLRLQIDAVVVDTATLSTGDATDTTTISNTITVSVDAVTDLANLVTADIQGLEDTEIDLSGLQAELIDQDGSEQMFLTISGVPAGAILKSGGVELINNGADGGTFNGQPTNSWTVSVDQLADLVLVPPLDFSGDIPLSLEAITKDQAPGQYVTTVSDFTVSVLPQGDPIDLIKAPNDNYTGFEDDNVQVDLTALTQDTQNDEFVQLSVRINSTSDLTALQSIDGAAFITSNGQQAFFKADGNGGFIATLVVESNLVQGFEFNAGPLAFGNFDMSVDVAAVDSALINGTTVTDVGDSQSADFSIELAPRVDAPIWVSVDDVNSTTTSNVALNLDLDLQNPANNEFGYVEIAGVPSGYQLSAGVLQDGVWTVDINDVESLAIVNGNDGDVFKLTLTPYAELNGESAQGAVEVINVSLGSAAAGAGAYRGDDFRDMGPDFAPDLMFTPADGFTGRSIEKILDGENSEV